MEWAKLGRSQTAILAALVLANIVPIVGVLALGWRTGDILLLYWGESAIIGFFAIIKMAVNAGWSALFFVPFFCFHFGLFMLIHLVFLVVFFLVGFTNLAEGRPFDVVTSTVERVSLGFAALLLSHAVSFVYFFLVKREGWKAPIARTMAAPYARVFVLHVTIIFAGVPVLFLGEPLFALVLLVALKIIVDVMSHVAAHHGKPWWFGGGRAAPPVDP